MAAKEKIKLEGDALAKHPTVKALAKAAGATIEVAQPSGAYARLVVQDKSGKPVTLLWLYHRPARDYVVLDNLKHRTAGMTDSPVNESATGRVIVDGSNLEAAVLYVAWAAKQAES